MIKPLDRLPQQQQIAFRSSEEAIKREILLAVYDGMSIDRTIRGDADSIREIISRHSEDFYDRCLVALCEACLIALSNLKYKIGADGYIQFSGNASDYSIRMEGLGMDAAERLVRKG